MRAKCINGKFIWCTRCWYGTTLLCAEGRQMTFRDMLRAVAAALLCWWAFKLLIRHSKLLQRARMLDAETVAYLQRLDASDLPEQPRRDQIYHE